MKIGIKSVYRAVRHLEKSSGKRDVTLRATHTLENCPYSQQVAICYLLYKHSPVSTTVSHGQSMESFQGPVSTEKRESYIPNM